MAEILGIAVGALLLAVVGGAMAYGYELRDARRLRTRDDEGPRVAEVPTGGGAPVETRFVYTRPWAKGADAHCVAWRLETSAHDPRTIEVLSPSHIERPVVGSRYGRALAGRRVHAVHLASRLLSKPEEASGPEAAGRDCRKPGQGSLTPCPGR